MAKKTSAGSLFGELFSAPFCRFSVAIIILDAVIVLLRCASPLIQRSLIDAVTAGVKLQFITWMIILAAVLVLAFAFESFNGWLNGKFMIAARSFLKGSIFRHLLTLPEDFLLSRGAGYFFNRIQNDVGEVLGFWRGGALSVISCALKLVIAWVTIALVSLKCALFAVPFLFLQSVICFLFRRRQYRLALHLQECAASERHVMQEYLARHRTVKTHAALENASARVESGLSRWGNLASMRLGNEYLFRSCLQLPVWLCAGTIAIYQLWLVTIRCVTLGEAWAVVTLTMLLFAPARILGGIFVQMEAARAAWNRLNELRQVKGESAAAGAVADVRLAGDIVFRDVAFGYDGRVLFDHVDFAVPGGEVLFLRGANGSGKSTLLALFLRLYELHTGEITIGGKEIGEFPLAAYRSRIGYIGQHPEFIKGSVRENLLLGNCNLSDDTLIAMLQELNFWSVLAPRGGLNAEVKENGDNFSGGEKLRLVLARELLRDTDILLFDEPAAHLDTAGRAQFYALMRKLHGKKSVLAAVHEMLPDELGKSFTLPGRDA